MTFRKDEPKFAVGQVVEIVRYNEPFLAGELGIVERIGNYENFFLGPARRPRPLDDGV